MHHDASFSLLVRMWSLRSSSRPSHSIWNVKVALSCPNGPMSWRPARPKSFHLQTQKLGKHMAIISGTTVALDVVRAMVEAFRLWHQSWDFRVEVESCRSANKARGVHFFHTAPCSTLLFTLQAFILLMPGWGLAVCSNCIHGAKDLYPQGHGCGCIQDSL